MPRSLSQLLLAGIIRREWFTFTLLSLFIALLALSPGFPSRIPSYFDYNALSLIVFYLLVSRGILFSGFAELVATRLSELLGGRAVVLVVLLSSYLLGMATTNDGAVLILAPLAQPLSRIMGASPGFLTAIIVLSANTGSVLVPFGNPQDIVIWQHYRLPITSYLAVAAPLSLLGLLVLIAHTWLLLRRTSSGLEAGEPLVLPRIRVKRLLAIASLSLLVVGAILGELGLGVYALLLGLLVLSLADYHVILGIDVSLVAAFTLMFPVFRELGYLASRTGFRLEGGLVVYFASLALGQVISNVPATIALTVSTSNWKALLLGANIAGYITPIGSMANIIGLRLSGTTWREYVERTAAYSATMILLGALLALPL